MSREIELIDILETYKRGLEDLSDNIQTIKAKETRTMEVESTFCDSGSESEFNEPNSGSESEFNEPNSGSESEFNEPNSGSESEFNEPDEKLPIGLRFGDMIEILWSYKNKRRWWPAKLCGVDNGWIQIEYVPMPPDFPHPTLDSILFLSGTLIENKEEEHMHWRLCGGKVAILPLVKPKRQRLIVSSDDDEEFINEFGSLNAVDHSLAATSFPRSKKMDLNKVEYKTASESSTGIYCSVCMKTRNHEDFSRKQAVVKDENTRFCLRHSTTSSFGKSAQTNSRL